MVVSGGHRNPLACDRHFAVQFFIDNEEQKKKKT